jgi:hypothetical protein
VFGTQPWSLICEVAAHARWITATDMALETGYFLSVSEDSFAKVWHISEEDGRVSLLYNTWTALLMYVLLDIILEFLCLHKNCSTPWTRVLLAEVILSQLVKKSYAVYGT